MSGVKQRGPLFKMRGMAGVRALGWQADVTNHRVRPPYFSERYSGQHGVPKHRRLHLGPLCFSVMKLTPAPTPPKETDQ